LLVIQDIGQSQVRLARLDAVRTAVVQGLYDGIVNDRVIVLNGTALLALGRDGKVTKLGQLAATPDWLGAGSVIVDPQQSRWLYSIRDNNSTTQVHLGTPSGDTVIATIPSPDGNAYYQTYAWNPSGVYMVREPVGLGGAGPFLDYHFPLVRFDLSTNRVTLVSPQCVAYGVLDDGTMICGRTATAGAIEVRSPTGQSHLIQVASGTGGTGTVYIAVSVSPDHKRLIVGRNGSKDPVINYQMAVADLSSSSAQAFGPLDYLPSGWLPDGRLVAVHMCTLADWGGGPCNAGMDGTYFFSADGASHSLFYKLVVGATVVGYL
jgi:hypothetical protein